MGEETIVRALEALADALGREDALEAGRAAVVLGEVCRAAAASGTRLGAPTLARAHTLMQRCEQDAARVNSTLRASLLQTSRDRRAIDSYRER
jgi:hypothetical protein